jgi:hypothetical protein
MSTKPIGHYSMPAESSQHVYTLDGSYVVLTSQICTAATTILLITGCEKILRLEGFQWCATVFYKNLLVHIILMSIVKWCRWVDRHKDLGNRVPNKEL